MGGPLGTGSRGWGVVILSPNGQVCELGGSEDDTTNNAMELLAALRALEWIESEGGGGVTLFSDSKYVVQGAQKWLRSWKRNGWKTQAGKSPANLGLWQDLDELLEKMNDVDWSHLEGHVGHPGNEQADAIANGFARGKHLELFDGDRSDYPHDLEKEIDRKRSKKKVMGYLSWVSGKAQIHKTWAECEQAVRGRSNARFKKVFSEEDAREVLRGWGAGDTEIDF